MYRVTIQHQDPEHENSEVAHIGPAFDSAYEEMAKHFTDEPVDLLSAATAFRDKTASEMGEGYELSVVELDTSTDPAEWKVVA